jgi:ubiquinone/menaquinone biosynthesis C-methylase UbiE
MSWFDLPRVPEPEVMDDSDEVHAYTSASAEAYLSRIDDSFVDHAIRLIGLNPGYALDIGCGPGGILKKISTRLPEWRCIGVDRSSAMIGRALQNGQPDSRVRLQFLIGDANALPFPDAAFDLVLCNSVLHHMSHPLRLLAEIRRVAKPGAAILLRDLRRPSWLNYPLHIRWHGRHYEGLMYRLFCDSVRAAYTPEELSAMLRDTNVPGARVFLHNSTHIGIERRAPA